MPYRDRVRTLAPLLVALTLFLAIGGWLSQSLGTWHEEESLYPSVAYRVLREPDPSRPPVPELEASCADDAPPRFVFSRERPEFAACKGGREYSVMTSPYFAGWIYWPSALFWALHRGDVFALRLFGLALGATSLVVTWAIVRRLAGDRTAGAVAMVTAVSSSFAWSHALLVHYELAPWALLAIAIGLLVECAGLAPRSPPDARVSTWRIALAALALGLALAANVKAVLLAAPLAALATRLGVRWKRVAAAQWAIALALLVAPLLPTIAFARLDPNAGFASQIQHRAQLLLHASQWTKVATEPLNLAIFWTDVGWYFDLISARHADVISGRAAPSTNWTAVAIAWGALAYAGVALVRVVKARRADLVVPAAAGAIAWPYLLISALLYDQSLAANYAPLHTVFGVGMGCAAVAAGRKLPHRWSLAPVAIAGALLFSNDLRHGDPSATHASAINAAAQRSMAAFLREHALEGAVLTTTYNLAGVVESLGHGEVRVVQAQRWFKSCEENRACLEDRWAALLGDARLRPKRVVAPWAASMVDERGADSIAPALEATAARLGWRVARERDFTTTGGVPVIAAWRIDPP